MYYIIYCTTYYYIAIYRLNVLVIIISDNHYFLFVYITFIAKLDVKCIAHELLDHHIPYIQNPQETLSDLPEWKESRWSKGGESGGYLTFSLALYFLLFILPGNIELNSKPENVKYKINY